MNKITDQGLLSFDSTYIDYLFIQHKFQAILENIDEYPTSIKSEQERSIEIDFLDPQNIILDVNFVLLLYSVHKI